MKVVPVGSNRCPMKALSRTNDKLHLNDDFCFVKPIRCTYYKILRYIPMYLSGWKSSSSPPIPSSTLPAAGGVLSGITPSEIPRLHNPIALQAFTVV